MYAPVALTGQGSQPLMPLQNSTASQMITNGLTLSIWSPTKVQLFQEINRVL